MNENTTQPTWSCTQSDPAGVWFFWATPVEHRIGGVYTLEDAPRRARWFGEVLGRVLRHAQTTATLRTVEVTTASRGDDAFTAALSEPGSVERLLQYVASCNDFVELSLRFSPRCVDLSGRQFEVPYGCELRIDVDVDDNSSPVLNREHPFTIALIAYTTLFTDATFDGSGDNRAWARANRPWLLGILERLAAEPELRLSACESPFHDQIRPFGFADLSQDYRGYYIGEGDNITPVIEQVPGGVEVVAVRRFAVTGNTLLVDYEQLRKGTEPTARIAILEHLVPDIVSRFERTLIHQVRFKNAISQFEATLNWPPKVSPPPMLSR